MSTVLFITDKHYTEAFLLIYPTFVTHQELINKLVHRLVWLEGRLSFVYIRTVLLIYYRLEYFYKENRLTMWTSCASLLVRVLKSVK